MSRPIGVAPAVVLIDPKYDHNVGNALRACACWGVDQLWWTGERVTLDVAKGERLPREERMRGYRNVLFRRHERPFDCFSDDVVPVAVELRKNAEILTAFEHPEKAVYVFGPEDGSLPPSVLKICHRFLVIPTHHCLNLAAAVNVVLYDRRSKRQLVKRDGRGDPVDPAGRYFIQDTRQVVGNCVLWWGIDRKGYVCDLKEAGVYSGEETLSLRDTDVPWPEALVRALAVEHVRSEALRGSRK